MAEFLPITRPDGYLPIADHGLIDNGTTVALDGLGRAPPGDV